MQSSLKKRGIRMKSTVGFVLALIGGIFSILGSIGIVMQSLVWSMVLGTVRDNAGEMEGVTVDQGVRSFPLIFGISFPLIFGIAIAVWMLIMGILAIVAAVKMNKDDDVVVKHGGIVALIVGILACNLLTIIGGVMGIVQSKEVEQPKVAQSSAKQNVQK